MFEIKNRFIGKIDTKSSVYISFNKEKYPVFLRKLLSSNFLDVNIPKTVFTCPEDEDQNKCKPIIGYVFDPRIDNYMGLRNGSVFYDKADNPFGFTSFTLQKKVINDLPLFFIKTTDNCDFVFFSADQENAIGGEIKKMKFAMSFEIEGQSQHNIYSGLPYKVNFFFINEDNTTRKIRIKVPILKLLDSKKSFNGVEAECKNKFFYITPKNIDYVETEKIYFTIYQKNYYYFSNTMSCQQTNDFAVPLLQFPERNTSQVFYTTKELCEFACGNEIKLCYLDKKSSTKNNVSVLDKECGTDGCFGLCKNTKEMCILKDGEFKCIQPNENDYQFIIFGGVGFILFIFIVFLFVFFSVRK